MDVAVSTHAKAAAAYGRASINNNNTLPSNGCEVWIRIGTEGGLPRPLLSWPRDQGTPVVREMYIWKCSKSYTCTIYSWLWKSKHMQVNTHCCLPFLTSMWAEWNSSADRKILATEFWVRIGPKSGDPPLPVQLHLSQSSFEFCLTLSPLLPVSQLPPGSCSCLHVCALYTSTHCLTFNTWWTVWISCITKSYWNRDEGKCSSSGELSQIYRQSHHIAHWGIYEYILYDIYVKYICCRGEDGGRATVLPQVEQPPSQCGHGLWQVGVIIIIFGIMFNIIIIISTSQTWSPLQCIDPHHHCQHCHRHQHHHHYQHYQHEHCHLHKPNVVTIVQRLRAEELFVDVTLATADRQVRQLNPIPQYGAIPFRPSKPGHHKA